MLSGIVHSGIVFSVTMLNVIMLNAVVVSAEVSFEEHLVIAGINFKTFFLEFENFIR
jgi:hypothetical protein